MSYKVLLSLRSIAACMVAMLIHGCIRKIPDESSKTHFGYTPNGGESLMLFRKIGEKRAKNAEGTHLEIAYLRS